MRKTNLIIASICGIFCFAPMRVEENSRLRVGEHLCFKMQKDLPVGEYSEEELLHAFGPLRETEPSDSDILEQLCAVLGKVHAGHDPEVTYLEIHEKPPARFLDRQLRLEGLCEATRPFTLNSTAKLKAMQKLDLFIPELIQEPNWDVILDLFFLLFEIHFDRRELVNILTYYPRGHIYLNNENLAKAKEYFEQCSGVKAPEVVLI